jgi:hypothetical protein
MPRWKDFSDSSSVCPPDSIFSTIFSSSARAASKSGWVLDFFATEGS